MGTAMPLPILCSTLAGGVIAAMGLLHVLYTLLDIRRPRYFAPSDDAVRLAMQGSTMRFARGRTSMWSFWLGFNISHGLGAIVLGMAAVYVPRVAPASQATLVFVALTVISIAYLITAVRFWFYKPTIGVAVATGLFLTALALEAMGAR
jgi:hypothetical protein